jgi:hypothetical protein
MNASLRFAARATLHRLRSRELAWLIGAALIGAAVLARVERGISPRNAVDRVLQHECLGLLLPVLAYVLFDRALLYGRIEPSISPISRHGGSTRSAVLGVSLVLTAALSAAGALLAFIGVLGAHGPQSPAILRDLSQSVWIGALGGAAYATWLTLASTIGRRGRGRIWFLLIDWLLGSSTGYLSLIWPRAHIRNLLGGEPSLELSQLAALLALLLGTALAAALTRTRVSD